MRYDSVVPITTKRRFRPSTALRRWLDDRGLSQVELAEMLSLSQAQVSRYLSGERSVSLAVILQLAHLTGLPAERLSNSRKITRILKLLGKRTNLRSETLSNKHEIA